MTERNCLPENYICHCSEEDSFLSECDEIYVSRTSIFVLRLCGAQFVEDILVPIYEKFSTLSDELDHHLLLCVQEASLADAKTFQLILHTKLVL